jgi:hypothetical protein
VIPPQALIADPQGDQRLCRLTGALENTKKPKKNSPPGGGSPTRRAHLRWAICLPFFFRRRFLVGWGAQPERAQNQRHGTAASNLVFFLHFLLSFCFLLPFRPYLCSYFYPVALNGALEKALKIFPPEALMQRAPSRGLFFALFGFFFFFFFCPFWLFFFLLFLPLSLLFPFGFSFLF